MKKILVLIIAMMIVVIPFSTMAEYTTLSFDTDFSIRNGVYFGMNKPQVIEKESEQGNKEGEVYRSVSIAHRASELRGETAYVDKNSYVVNTTVAGQDALAIYTFDQDEKMNSLRYLTCSSFSSTPLLETLMAKYGLPTFAEPASPFESKAFNYYALCDRSWRAVLHEYAGWLVQYKDTYVLIEAVQFFEYEEVAYYENITYTPISYELYTDYQNSINQAQNSIENDM